MSATAAREGRDSSLSTGDGSRAHAGTVASAHVLSRGSARPGSRGHIQRTGPRWRTSASC